MDLAPSSAQFQDDSSGAAAGQAGVGLVSIGSVLDIAGSNSQILLDRSVVDRLAGHSDPSVAMAGQVGSQVKIKVGAVWLVASVRALQLDPVGDAIKAQIDFLGEGDEERLTGRLYKFRRGVTRYPVPGAQVYSVSSLDMKEMYAAA